MTLYNLVTMALLLLCSAWIVVQARDARSRRAQLYATQAKLDVTENALAKRINLTAPELRAEATRLEAEHWKTVAGNFQGAVASASARLDAATMPDLCVFDGCDDDPVTMQVATDGHVDGVCERHRSRWARLDEDERRRVRSGASS